MTEETFNFILQTGSYNGEAYYNSYEEMEQDYKTLNAVSLTPAEIRRLIFIAYNYGKLEKGNENEKRN